MTRQEQIVAAAMLRHVVQRFDSGGESQRSFRARFASAAFHILHEDAPDFWAEYEKLNTDPGSYLSEAERDSIAIPEISQS